MPRPNASDSSRNKRTPRGGSSSGRPFSKGRSDARPGFKKGRGKDEGGESKKRPYASGAGKPPYKKFDKKDSPKSFGKRSEGGDDKKRSFSSRSDKPFKKFDRGDSKPYGKRAESGDDTKRSFSSRGDKPFKKFDRGDSKPYGKRAEGGDDTKRSFSSRGDKPFKKFDRGDSKPYGKRAESGDDTKRSFSSRGDKPYKKSDRKDSGKSFGRGDDNKRSFSSRSDKPYKKYDKPEGPSDTKKFKDSSADERPPRKSFSKSGSRARIQKEPVMEAPVQTEKIRLNRYIANSGVCSRREADELITMGLITVNGKSITELGYKVNPGDEVRYEGRLLKAEKPVYILMNKPKGYLTTTVDPQERNTVMHILGSAIKERVYPVGRLDRNTTGLLLLTNDGELADKLMHPSYNAKKIYRVELDRPLTKGDFQKIAEGVRLEEGVAQVDDLAIVSEDNKTVGIELHIGWNRVVRRIFESLEYQVVKLDRSVYAGLDKKDLGRGEWRYLRKEEIVRLKHYSKSGS